MRFALVVDTFLPGKGAAGLMMFDLSQGLIRNGHAVTVITPDSKISSRWAVEKMGGAVVLRIRTGRLKGTGLVHRALNEMLMPLHLVLGARRSGILAEGFDAVIWYSPSIFLGPFVAWLKRQVRARAYLIVRDMFPQWAVDVGLLRPGLAYWFFKRFEQYQYGVADVIGVQSPANCSYFIKNPPRTARLEVLWNWTDLERPAPDSTDVVARHGLTGMRLIVYGGNMGVAQDMNNLVRLATRLRKVEGIKLLMVGSGSETARLRHLVHERMLTNIVFLSEVDPEEFRALLRYCQIGLISLDRRLTTHNIPGKLLAYLEAGLPIIASVNPNNDLLTLLPESGAGEAVLNGNDEQFAVAVMRILEDESLRSRMSAHARELAQQCFDAKIAVRQLISAFHN